MSGAARSFTATTSKSPFRVEVRADEVSPDPAEAVDAYLECHAPPVSVRGPL